VVFPELEMNGYNFTERVRKVLSRSREQAIALRHEYVGTEHILLALLEGGGVAPAVLENLGVDADDVRKKVLESVTPGRADSPITAVAAASGGLLGVIADTIGYPHGPDLPYTSRAKKSLEFAMSEARDLSHSYVGTEHLLIGLMREQRNIAAQSLAAMGLTVPHVRDEVLRLLGTEMPARPAPAEARVRDDLTDQEAAITLVVEHTDGRMEAKKFRSTRDAVSFLNSLEQ
jgi:ATP-dependent Clp protease ATP-binding subunit ClpC